MEKGCNLGYLTVYNIMEVFSCYNHINKDCDLTFCLYRMSGLLSISRQI